MMSGNVSECSGKRFFRENGRSGRGILFVVSSASGGGKTTLCRKLEMILPDLVLSVSHTTRKPRPNERDGIDYYFVSDSVFQEMIREGEFIEWANVHGMCYGTSRRAVEGSMKRGIDCFLDIDVQGARQVKNFLPDSVLIFVIPPDEEELLRRLKKRGTESSGELDVRVENAKKELAQIKIYDYAVFNQDLDEAVNALCSIVVCERCRVSRRP